jgi:hypothetical protein
MLVQVFMRTLVWSHYDTYRKSYHSHRHFLFLNTQVHGASRYVIFVDLCYIEDVPHLKAFMLHFLGNSVIGESSCNQGEIDRLQWSTFIICCITSLLTYCICSCLPRIKMVLVNICQVRMTLTILYISILFWRDMWLLHWNWVSIQS